MIKISTSMLWRNTAKFKVHLSYVSFSKQLRLVRTLKNISFEKLYVFILLALKPFEYKSYGQVLMF